MPSQKIHCSRLLDRSDAGQYDFFRPALSHKIIKLMDLIGRKIAFVCVYDDRAFIHPLSLAGMKKRLLTFQTFEPRFQTSLTLEWYSQFLQTLRRDSPNNMNKY